MPLVDQRHGRGMLNRQGRTSGILQIDQQPILCHANLHAIDTSYYVLFIHNSQLLWTFSNLTETQKIAAATNMGFRFSLVQRVLPQPFMGRKKVRAYCSKRGDP